MGRKKKAAAAAAKATAAIKSARRTAREERRVARSAKKEHRKRDRKAYTADMWAVPAPAHLVAKLEAPKHKSKYHSYFEFAENTEKKKKRLEFKVDYASHALYCLLQLTLRVRLRMTPILHPVLNLSLLEIQP